MYVVIKDDNIHNNIHFDENQVMIQTYVVIKDDNVHFVDKNK